ncbi:MAG: methyltransferase domain-containing protein [Chitinophagales bacterium]|nr:methyltransferase domain-containing protein [Chitinophagales bacterium]
MKNTENQAIEEKQYVLGTERAELHRLGLQHQVWSAEARRGWELAGFRNGHTLLDLGCGPGFCTTELAYLAGENGKVIGVDFAANYVSFLQQQSALHGLDIVVQHASFDTMQLEANSLDGAFARWALAWVSNPEEVIARVKQALKPGGRFVIQEYFDWSVFQTEPAMPTLKKAISACYRSMKEQAGDIDVGRHIPAMAARVGLKVVHTRAIAKLTGPAELTWHWPYSFLHIYLPKIAERGFLTPEEVTQALHELNQLTAIPEARILCPVVLELVLEK